MQMWKTVPEVGARNWKSAFADCGETERRYSKLVIVSVFEKQCSGLNVNSMR